MEPKLLIACALLTTTTVVGSVNASPIWTVVTSGTISEGYDCLPWESSCPGLFGLKNQDLAGQKFTISITASIDPTKWSMHVKRDGWEHLLGVGPGFSTTVSVNGYSARFAAPFTAEGQQLVFGTFAGGWTVGSSAYNVGRTAKDDYVFVAGSAFEIFGSYTTHFRGNIEASNIVLGEAPEPASFALVSLGLAGLSVLRCRSSHKQEG